MQRLILAIIRFLLRFCPGYHLHKDPRKRVNKPEIKPLSLIEKEDEKPSPRHTPEELDRLIEMVRKANSPEIEAKEL